MSSHQTTETAFSKTTESLIRYVEIWIPNGECTHLERVAARAVRPEHRPTGSSSPTVKVASGEGIAGAAWNQKSATILQEEPSDLLQQISSDAGTELAAVIALPVFRQQNIRGVVVLGFSSVSGAAEIWSRDDRDELAVTSGHYSGLPSFEFITRYTRFPKGAGVPGTVWKTGEPKLAQDLETSSTFIRSFGNDPSAITSAIGIPVANSRGFPSSILLLLSAGETPLAVGTDVWKCQSVPGEDESGAMVARIQSFVRVGGVETEEVEDWQSAVMTKVNETLGPVLWETDTLPLPEGASFCVAVPIFKTNEITGVVSFVF